MSGAQFFIVGIIVVVMGGAFYSIKDLRLFKENPKLKNVLGGILMVVALAIIFAFWGNKANAQSISGLNYVQMFVGMDYDFDNQRFCRDAAPGVVVDDRLTSNVGFRANLLSMPTLRSELNAKYQHHSCAYNQDKPTYDAAGIEARVNLLKRLHLFIGLDYDFKNQVFCSDPNDKWTVNAGFIARLYRTQDGKSELNFNYQFHECAHGGKLPHYQGAGINFTYRIGQ